MRVIIYESSSTGGCYEYSLYLFKHYAAHPKVEECELLIPKGSQNKIGNHLLLNDQKRSSSPFLSRIYFLIRSLVNPLILFYYLIKKKKSFVILNDFEQMTSFFWVPLFMLLRKKHVFAIFLHDPDRDNYTSSRWYSRFSMDLVMKIPHLALFHEVLPEKPYYQNSACKYLEVPHGLYDAAVPDKFFFETYVDTSVSTFIIPGNIRSEKNYELCIEAIQHIEGVRLIIAGSPASSEVNIEKLREMAEELGVSNKVAFILKYLSNEEMSALIDLADVALIYYSRSFSSQSGIFNLIAPHRLKILASDLHNPMTLLINKFNLGICVEPDNVNSLIKGMQTILKSDKLQADWEGYYAYASWHNHINKVITFIESENLIK